VRGVLLAPVCERENDDYCSLGMSWGTN